MSAPAVAAPTIRLDDLNHWFGKGEVSQHVLCGIDLEIKAGELVILTGRSGCGKTTMLTLIGALRSVQNGSLQVLGTELNGLSKKERIDVRRNIGFIFQAHNLLDALSACQNVNLGVALQPYTPETLHERAVSLLGILQTDRNHDPLAGASRTVRSLGQILAGEMLAHLGLRAHIHKKPKELSGGQKQRVAIARALINYPRLVLADEPTAALDAESAGIVVDLLRHLANSGTTIIVVTHDNRIMDKGDRIVTMEDGRIASDIRVDKTVAICLELRKVSFLSRLTLSRLVELAEKMRIESCPAGTVIVRQGDVGDKFFLLRDGTADVVVAENGDSRTLNTLKKGDPFGEMALLTGEPRNATVIARGPVEMYTLGKADFLDAMAKSESMHDELVKVFAQRSRHP
jgi:putative ABC transport system ATP-binding protein